MRSDDPGAAPASPAPGAIRVEGHHRQDLTSGWRVAAADPDACAGPEETEGLDWLPAAVPGTAAGALRVAGRWDFGAELDLDAFDWWFRTEFEAAPAAPEEVVLLRLDGVATVHEVFLNGERIGGGESMFAAAAIDVGALVREGSNELAIRCRALAPLLGTKRSPRARWRTRLADNRLRFFRTMLLGRCPGFAPGPAAVGPWRPVWIERRRGLSVSGIDLRPRCEGEDGLVSVRMRGAMLDGAAIDSATVVVSGPDQAEATLEVIGLEAGEFEVGGELRVPRARRWWPHTQGDPTLYSVSVRLRGAAGAEALVDAGRIGFREIAPGPSAAHEPLVDGIDLHVNGVRTFVRGAIWTPDDFVGMAPGRERLRAALERVRSAGMNMLRIPGTGAYESADFHDLCDELGILVWQDFMFANFDYPLADDGFRAAVEAEAREQLAAVAGRPSLVVVCGNSEVEQQAAMLGRDGEMGRGELFGELLPAALASSGADAIYLPSAPSGGARPFQPDRGVANYFGVGGYRRPLSDVRLAGVRFASECLAIANVPDEAGVEAILPGAPADVVVHHPRWKAGVPRDAGTGWDFDDVRDHYLRELFGVDPAELRRVDHERYLDLSRFVSAQVMSAVFGEWRRAGSPCGGGLVLWLRDLVPGAGWGLVDHSGAPKRALQGLAEILAPTAVWMTDEGLAGVGVHVANDGPEPLAATLRIALFADFEQNVGEAETELDLGPHDAISLDLETVLGRFVDASWAYRFGPPAQSVITACLERGDGDDPTLASAAYFPAGMPTERRTAGQVGLRGEVVDIDGDSASVRLEADRFLFGLTLQTSAVVENPPSFLQPGRPREVIVRSTGSSGAPPTVAVSALNLKGKLTLPSRRD
jgi:beta-mannosidase